MQPSRPLIGQVVTVFRSRLRPEHTDEYADELTVVAEDGERCTVVTFADPASHGAWRDHPRHREAQRHGIADYYAEYSIAVGETTYASSFAHDPDL